MSMPGTAETLERLIIEIVGDDSKLRAALESAVKAAQEAADKMRAALNIEVDLSGATKAAQDAHDASESVAGTMKMMQALINVQVRQMEEGFLTAAASGEHTKESFEALRVEFLNAIDGMMMMVRSVGISTEAYERLRDTVANTTATYREATTAAAQNAVGVEDLAEQIAYLSNQIKVQRNLWASRAIDAAEFSASTRKLRNEILELASSAEAGSKEMVKITQAAAYAQRGLDSAAGVASRGGLAWTVQIALTNQFGQALRNLGPAGGAAASTMGFVSGAVKSLQQPVTMADVSFKKLFTTISRFSLVIAPMATALAAIAGAAGLSKLVVDAAAAADAIDKAAQSAGFGVEAFQEVSYALKQTGVSADQTRQGLNDFNTRLGQAAAGSKTIAAAYKQLGVDVRDTNGQVRSGEEVFTDLITALSRVHGSAQQAALGGKVFGEEFSRRIIPALNLGAEGFQALRNEARQLGLVLSGDTVLTLTEFHSQVETLKQRFNAAKIEIGAAFLPVVRDILLPLFEDKVIPLLQTVATRVQEFTDKLFDAGEEGEQFRTKVIAFLQPLLSSGDILIAAGQGFVAFSQLMIGAAAGIGAVLGTLEAQFNQFYDRMANLGEGLAWWQQGNLLGAVEVWKRFGQAVGDSFKLPDLGQAFEDAAGPFLDAALATATAARERLARGISGDYAHLFDALIPPKATPRMRANATTLATDLTNGVREALEGSLKHAQLQAEHYFEEFSYATTDAAKAEAHAQYEYWTQVAEAILNAFKDADPTQMIRLWVERLTYELEHGLKDARTVIDLTRSTATSIATELGQMITHGLGETDAAKVLKEQLALLTPLLEEAGQDMRDIVLRALRGVPGEAPAPTITSEDIDRLLGIRDLRDKIEEAIRFGVDPDQVRSLTTELVKLITAGAPELARVAEAQANAYLARAIDAQRNAERTATKLELLRQQRIAAEERDARPTVTGDPLGLIALTDQIQWLVKVKGEEAEILKLINQLTAIRPMSVTDLNRLTNGWYLARLAASEYRQAAEDAFNESPTLTPVVATLEARLNPAMIEAERNARLLGQAWDPITAKAGILEGIVKSLADRYDDLSEGEKAVLEQAATDLRNLTAAMDTKTIDAFFTTWLSGVNAIGITLGPVEQAGVDLAQAMADGKLTAEQYALALDALADAAERLAAVETDRRLAEQAAEMDRLRDAATNARNTIDTFLRVPQADHSDLREAIEAAWKAGVIGVNEYRDAMSAIDAMTLTDNLRILAGQLEGAGGVIATFTADIIQAAARLAAGNTWDAIALGFQAATTAVKGLAEAFSDASRAGEAAFDLITGAAATIGTIVGGPAVGQAIGAIGGFIKTILGDLTNGLEQIRQAVSDAASASATLGDSVIEGIARSATSRVSRGGLLGLLGMTKAQLDQDAFRAGVSAAEAIASGLINTLKADDFQKAWDDMVDQVIVQGMIDRLLATQAVQDAILAAWEAMEEGRTNSAIAALEQVRERFRQVADAIRDLLTPPQETFIDVTRGLTSALTSAFQDGTVEDAWDRATASMRDVLRDRIIQAFVEGRAMTRIFDAFNKALTDALTDAVITPEELALLEGIFADAEGPLRALWEALEKLGLGFENLNDVVDDVTSSLSNVPHVFKIAQATMDAINTGSRRGTVYDPILSIPRDPTDRNLTINFNGPVYGLPNFEDQVRQAVATGSRRTSLATFGLTGGSG